MLDCTIEDLTKFLLANGQNMTALGIEIESRKDIEYDAEDLRKYKEEAISRIEDEEPSWDELKSKSFKIGNFTVTNNFRNRLDFGRGVNKGWKDEIRKRGKRAKPGFTIIVDD
jgi:hypothetical protein